MDPLSTLVNESVMMSELQKLTKIMNSLSPDKRAEFSKIDEELTRLLKMYEKAKEALNSLPEEAKESLKSLPPADK
jgi:uncharacterized protein (DUF342 family)